MRVGSRDGRNIDVFSPPGMRKVGRALAEPSRSHTERPMYYGVSVSDRLPFKDSLHPR